MFVIAPSNHHLSDHACSSSFDVTGFNAVAAAATAAATHSVGVIPLLTATPCLTVEERVAGNVAIGNLSGNFSNQQSENSQKQTFLTTFRPKMSLENRHSDNNIQLWETPPNYSRKHILFDHGFGGGGSGSGSGSGRSVSMSMSMSGSTMTCQDCGNNAKKDCNHQRCRTCCKNRGFDCETHVKSTWVSAASRRERELITSSSVSTSGTKKPRLASHTTTTPSHTSTSNTTTPRSFDTSSSHHQDASFMNTLPGQVRAPAVFKCVRVTAVEDGDDEYAYQACVRISGHVFKGFLYDQGVEPTDQMHIPNLSDLHLGSGGGPNDDGSLTSQPPDPPAVYGSSGDGLLG